MLHVLLVSLLGCASDDDAFAAPAQPAAQRPAPVRTWSRPARLYNALEWHTALLPDGRLIAPGGRWSSVAPPPLMVADVSPGGLVTWTPLGVPTGEYTLSTRAADGDGDGVVDVVAVTADDLLVFDAATGALTARIPTPVPWDTVYKGAVPLQLDADPAPEWLVTTRTAAWHLDDDGVVTDTIAWTCSDDATVSLIDAATGPQIVGCQGDVLDPATFAVIDQLPYPSVVRVQALDLDGDGGDDRLVVSTDGFTAVWDGSTRQERFQVSQNIGSVVTPALFDLNGDGRDELPVLVPPVAGARGSIVGLDPITGAGRSHLFAPRGDVHPYAGLTWDHDGDGVPTLLIGGTSDISAVHAGAPARWVAGYPGLNPGTSGLARVRIRGAEPRLVATSLEGVGGQVLVDLNGRMLGQRTVGASGQAMDGTCTQALDLDGDGTDELAWRANGLVTTQRGPHVISAVPGTRWTFGDLDGDGDDEIVRVDGMQLIVDDARPLRTLTILADPVGRAIAAADVNGDGADEVLVLQGGALLAVDGQTGATTPLGPTSADAVHASAAPGGDVVVWLVDPAGTADMLRFSGGVGAQVWRDVPLPVLPGSTGVVAGRLFVSSNDVTAYVDPTTADVVPVDVGLTDACDVVAVPGGFALLSDRVFGRFTW